MLTSIDLENYRGFRRYRLANLARVNLLTGRNNCGKTAILEAINLVASGGDPQVLVRAARQRGEVALTTEGGDGVQRRAPGYPIMSHFFHGHEFRPGAQFRLGTGDGFGELSITVVPADSIEQAQRAFFFVMERHLGRPLGLAIRIDGSRHPLGKRGFPVWNDAAIPVDLFQRFGLAARGDQEGIPPVQFITPDSLQPSTMSDMWNKIIVEGREKEVVEAIRVLEPTLSNIFFLTGASVLVAFEGTQRRDPIGSHGEGMRRLLALAVSLIQTEGGVLLVDEIDTGLHYSVMGDMWHLVVETAKRLNVQVVATTHSADCVRGLAWVCENYPNLRDSISVQKIEPALEAAVAMDADKLMVAVEQGIEVR